MKHGMLVVLIFIAMILWNGFKETIAQLVDMEEEIKKLKER